MIYFDIFLAGQLFANCLRKKGYWGCFVYSVSQIYFEQASIFKGIRKKLDETVSAEMRLQFWISSGWFYLEIQIKSDQINLAVPSYIYTVAKGTCGIEGVSMETDYESNYLVFCIKIK